MSFPLTGPIDIQGGEILASTGDLTLNPTGAVVLDATAFGPLTTGTVELGTDAVRWSGVFGDEVDGGNINISGNTITSTNTNGAVNIVSTGSGPIDLTSGSNVNVGGILRPDVTDSQNLGTSTRRWNTVFGQEVRPGDLSLTGSLITSTLTNGDVDISPTGTGSVNVSEISVSSGAIDGVVIGGTTPADGSFTQVDAGNLNLTGNTISSTNANGAVNIVSTGSGPIDLTSGSNVNVTGTLRPAVTDVQNLGTAARRWSGVFGQEVSAGNIMTSGNLIASTNTDGNINITPDGTGSVNIANIDVSGGEIDGTVIGGNTPADGEFTQVVVDSLTLDGTSITSTGVVDVTASGNINLAPTGGNVRVDGNTVPDSAGTYNLGATGNRWAGVFSQEVTAGSLITSGNTIQADSGSITLDPAAGGIVFVNSSILPNAVATHTVGASTTPYSTVYSRSFESDAANPLLVQGSTTLDLISANGNITIESIDGDIALTATNGLVTSEDNFLPSSDNGSSLGSAGRRWTDVFASNGVINTSDARLKTDVETMDEGLKQILEMRPVSFKWIGDEKLQSKKHYGFIAQELEKIVPNVIRKSTDYAKSDLPPKKKELDEKEREEDILGVKYDSLIPILVNAVKELSARVEQLESDLE